jgi:phage shock protein A
MNSSQIAESVAEALDSIQSLKHKLDLKEAQLQKQEERLARLDKQLQNLKQTIIQSGNGHLLKGAP